MNEKHRRHLQEARYTFPYHYIPTWDGRRFSQTVALKWGYVYMSYLHFVLQQIRATAFDALLDVGCGDGRFLKELRALFPQKRLVGLDISQRAITFARLMVPEVEWMTGDVRRPGALQGAFDALTLIETLEHIPPDDMKGFVDGLAACLRPGGRLFLTVPSCNVAVDRKHYQHFDLKSLTAVLSPRFDIDTVHYLNKKSLFVKKVLRKCISNQFFHLNQRHLLRGLFCIYRRWFLVTDAAHCSRIALVGTRRGDRR